MPKLSRHYQQRVELPTLELPFRLILNFLKLLQKIFFQEFQSVNRLDTQAITFKVTRGEPVKVKVHSYQPKYNGELVLIGLKVSEQPEIVEERKISIRLDIAFGDVEEEFNNQNGGAFSQAQKGYIRFGIKHGKLRLNLKNGAMPLNQRGLLKDPNEEWVVRTIELNESPAWEFEARGTPAVLRGARVAQKLGIIDLSDTFCIVEASFNVSTSRTDLEIIAQDGVWDIHTRPKIRATKIAAFFKHVVEPKLKDYLSKVVLEYDSDTIS